MIHTDTNSYFMQPIARITTDFQEKFGIPRQSGLAETHGIIRFLPPFQSPEAIRGLEDFSHIWLIWGFSEHKDVRWHPTVRPPRLGGNERVGVFATRSPFRPNPIGLSCVRLDAITLENNRPILHVTGADLLDQTPIFDIKPYLAYADAHPEASGGFTANMPRTKLTVCFPDDLLSMIPEDKRDGLISLLEHDPRPPYQADPERIYGILFAGYQIRFTVAGTELHVQSVISA